MTWLDTVIVEQDGIDALEEDDEVSLMIAGMGHRLATVLTTEPFMGHAGLSVVWEDGKPGFVPIERLLSYSKKDNPPTPKQRMRRMLTDPKRNWPVDRVLDRNTEMAEDYDDSDVARHNRAMFET